MPFKTLLAVALLVAMTQAAGQPAVPLPAEPLRFGGFSARFGADGLFALEGHGWPPFKGTWKRERNEIELMTNYVPYAVKTGDPDAYLKLGVTHIANTIFGPDWDLGPMRELLQWRKNLG